jgi:hypothetical protein
MSRYQNDDFEPRGRDDDDAILHDGQRVRVSMMMRDSTDGSDLHKHPTLHDGRGGKPGRRPGYALADRAGNDQRQAAYTEYEDGLTKAWRNDAAPPIQRREAYADQGLTIDEIYRRYDRELEEAWKARP